MSQPLISPALESTLSRIVLQKTTHASPSASAPDSPILNLDEACTVICALTESARQWHAHLQGNGVPPEVKAYALNEIANARVVAQRIRRAFGLPDADANAA